MSLSKDYLNSLKTKVLRWELASEVKILKEKLPQEIDAGFIRIKVILKNGDALELSEYVVGTESEILVKSYTFHWQDSEGRLKKRWDNAEHYQKVSTYPHHLHDGNEGNVVESETMNFEKVREIIRNEIELT